MTIAITIAIAIANIPNIPNIPNILSYSSIIIVKFNQKYNIDTYNDNIDIYNDNI